MSKEHQTAAQDATLVALAPGAIKMQAIQTKYLGPMCSQGSRVKATCAAGFKTLEWDDALNTEQNHAAAARALGQKLKWSGQLVGGGLKDGTFVWVFTNSSEWVLL